MKNKLLAGVIALILVAAVFAGVWWWREYNKPGVYLGGKITVIFEDGSKAEYTTDPTNLLSLYKLTVLTNSGKKIASISCDPWIKYYIKPPDKTAKVQYLVIFYIEVTGPFFTGARSYSSLTGFIDLPVSHYTDTVTTNRWVWLGNVGFFSSDIVEYFYRERGSGLQVGCINLGAEYAKAVTDALSGNYVSSQLAKALTTAVAVVEKRNGDFEYLVNWRISGPDFYVLMKRIDWQGLALHSGSFTVGAGKFMRIWPGDQYTITFKVGYFFRHQDLTGDWSPWKAGTVTLATLKVNAQEGYWVQVDLDIGSGVKVAT